MVTEHAKPGSTDDQARSLYAVRRAIGVVGLSLPALLIGYSLLTITPEEPVFLGSISAYYHTLMGDVLVGGLCAVGVFLLSYLGYKRKEHESHVFTDFWVSCVAGIGALGVALLPTGVLDGQCQPGDPVGSPPLRCAVQGFYAHPEWLHFTSAAVFFAAISIMCIFLFPRTPSGDREYSTGEGLTYALCGFVLASAGAGLIFVNVARLTDGNAVFWLELIGIVAFSIAWLVKGKTILGMKRALSRAA